MSPEVVDMVAAPSAQIPGYKVEVPLTAIRPEFEEIVDAP